MNQNSNEPQPPQYRQPPQQAPQYGQGQPPQQPPNYGQPSPYGPPPQQYGQPPQPPQQYRQPGQMPPSPQYGQMPTTGIQIHASFFPLSFFLFFCTPIVVIDGQAQRTSWFQPLFFPLSPGMHNIKIFFRYIWMAECGANSAQVFVEPGRVASIKYFMPPWIYAAGSITQEQAFNAPRL